MRLIDADALQKQFDEKCIHDCEFCPSYLHWVTEELEEEGCCVLIQRAPTINAVPVVHYKDTNTTVLNVKSIEDWQDRIILDEGEESRSGAVYYTDSDDMVRVVRCKDCRYSEPMKKHGVYRLGESSLNCTQCRGDDGYGYSGISVVQPDDYCSDGALKDEEETTK